MTPATPQRGRTAPFSVRAVGTTLRSGASASRLRERPRVGGGAEAWCRSALAWAAGGHESWRMNPLLWLPVAAVTVLAVSVGYFRLFRPWQLRWGATADEIGRPLPGDEVVPEPTFDATRAITIRATPEQIWPWLLQVGVTRAGWYSYDRLDNFGRPSAREIIPALQARSVGDVMPMSPDGRQGVQVLAMDLPRSMMWGTLPDTTWLWFIEPGADGTTRLISRIRKRYRWLSSSIAFALLIEFVDIWMIRKMLLNLRQRAEALAAAGAAEPVLLPKSTS